VINGPKLVSEVFPSLTMRGLLTNEESWKSSTKSVISFWRS